MEKRQIILTEEGYQMVKPKEGGGWHTHGKRMSTKALADLFDKNRNRFEIYMSEGVACSVGALIEEYKKNRKEASKEYFSRRGLETKTI